MQQVMHQQQLAPAARWSPVVSSAAPDPFPAAPIVGKRPAPMAASRHQLPQLLRTWLSFGMRGNGLGGTFISSGRLRDLPGRIGAPSHRPPRVAEPCWRRTRVLRSRAAAPRAGQLSDAHLSERRPSLSRVRAAAGLDAGASLSSAQWMARDAPSISQSMLHVFRRGFENRREIPRRQKPG